MLRTTYEYSGDVSEVTMDILKKTQVKKQKTVTLCVVILCLAVGILGCIFTDDGRAPGIVLAAIVAAIVTMRNKNYKKILGCSYSIDMPESIVHGFSRTRSLEVHEDHVYVTAEYSEPGTEAAFLDSNVKAQSAWVKKNAERSTEMVMPYDKCDCYENDRAFVLFNRRKRNHLTLLKEWFKPEETELMREIFSSAMGKKYRRLQG